MSGIPPALVRLPEWSCHLCALRDSQSDGTFRTKCGAGFTRDGMNWSCLRHTQGLIVAFARVEVKHRFKQRAAVVI